MKDMIVVYVPCVSTEEAVLIGREVMKARQAPCFNVLPGMISAAFWPAKSGKIEEVSGAVLIVKSTGPRFAEIEQTVKQLHSDTNPCIFSLPVQHVSKEYYEWLLSEMEAQ